MRGLIWIMMVKLIAFARFRGTGLKINDRRRGTVGEGLATENRKHFDRGRRTGDGRRKTEGGGILISEIGDSTTEKSKITCLNLHVVKNRSFGLRSPVLRPYNLSSVISKLK